MVVGRPGGMFTPLKVRVLTGADPHHSCAVVRGIDGVHEGEGIHRIPVRG
jgi:hypothetical protein